MDRTFGCEPFYFGGAIILFTVGGLFVYFVGGIGVKWDRCQSLNSE